MTRLPRKPDRLAPATRLRSIGRKSASTVLDKDVDALEAGEMEDGAATKDVLSFPLIPLASGQAFTDSGGEPVRIRTIEVVVTTVDGRESRIPLTSGHGGWWARPPF